MGGSCDTHFPADPTTLAIRWGGVSAQFDRTFAEPRALLLR